MVSACAQDGKWQQAQDGSVIDAAGMLRFSVSDYEAYWVHGLSRIRLCLVASIECPVGDSAKTRQFASSDMLVNLMIQPVSIPMVPVAGPMKMESSVYMGNG